MPPRADAWRDRPFSGQNGSTSADFAFTFTSDLSAAPQPNDQPSTADTPKEDGVGNAVPTAAGAVADEIEQLEDEVIHFMDLSYKEKENSKMLSGRLASVTQQKEELERQLIEMVKQEAARSQCEKEKDIMIEKLTEDLRRNHKRRVRAVAIAIDLSGSAAGSLTEGIKKIYAHLLGELQRSPCQTYVMTVIHGPRNSVVVKTYFGDTWATHEKVLEGQKADGMEQHVECLRTIKEVAVTCCHILDMQVVLLGDSNTNPTSHFGAKEVCNDFSCSNPIVHIHSVGVKTGSAEETETNRNGMEFWYPWNYASATGGNTVVWWQDSPLPDLSSLVY